MILLYNPASSPQRKPVLPMSLLALGALLEGEHDYRIVDGNLAPDPLAELDILIRESGADILGMTVMPGPQLSQAVPLSRELKKRHPQLTIVWGGYFPTQHYEACLRAEFVDFAVRGHGEWSFKALVDLLRRGGSLKQPGLAHRRSDGGMCDGVPLPPLPDLDSLPDFPYHRVKMPRYLRRTFMGKTLSHHSSYGCPFVCNFCAVVNMVQGRWRAQSAERTATVVHRLVQDWGAEAIEFHDNNFFVDEARVSEFSERVRNLGIRWWGEARIDTVLKFSDRTWRRMSESGLQMVFLGAESGSDETLQRMQKGGTASTEKTLELAERARRYGVIPEFSFMLGYPPDPERDIEQTLRFIRRLKRVNPASEIILYLYTPVPLEGDLYSGSLKSGFRFPETLEEWIDPAWREFSLRRSGRLPWLQVSVRRRIRNFERVLNAYYPTSTNPDLTGLRRTILRTAGGWRYHLRAYGLPVELRALQRIFSYQRPETSGF